MLNETETAVAREIQDRVDRKAADRAALLDPMSRTSMSSVDEQLHTGQETEAAVCEKCGHEFERIITIIGPSRLRAPCPKCSAEERAARDKLLGVQAPKEPEEAMLDWLADLGVNTRKHGHATIENFDDTFAPKAPRASSEFVNDVVVARRHDRVRGLYLASDGKGNGKTHLAVAIVRAVRSARPDLKIVFDPADRLITKIQDSYGTGSTDQVIELRARAGLYVLDDLGREKDTTDALRSLCTILDERDGAPTVITSNHLPKALGERHSDGDLWARVSSRLGDEVYRYIEVGGPDRRRRGVQVA